MKRIAIALSLSLTLAACGEAQEHKKSPQKPEDQVISEPAHGAGALFGKPDPDAIPLGTPVESDGFKVTLPEERWEETTINAPSHGRDSKK